MSCRQAADPGSWPAANAGAPATCESVHLSIFATAQAAALALPVASSELQLRRRKNAAGHNADSTVLRGRGQARWEGMCLGAACIRARWWGKGQVLWEGLKGVRAHAGVCECRHVRGRECVGVCVHACQQHTPLHGRRSHSKVASTRLERGCTKTSEEALAHSSCGAKAVTQRLGLGHL